MKSLSAGIFLVAFCALIFIPLSGCETDSREYVRLAKTVFEKSVRNDPSGANLIDWNTFQCDNEDLGRSYISLSTEYEKSHFKSAVIDRLSQLYASRNWNVNNVRNWKLQSKGVESAIVTADAPNGTITVTFQKVDFQKKISRIMNQ